MSENFGTLYVRTDSEDDQSTATASSTPKKSTSLSSLRSLRDTFKRTESQSSQVSLANSNGIADDTAKKPGKLF